MRDSFQTSAHESCPATRPVIAEDMTRPCAVSLRAILKRHKTFSRSQYFFVRFGERVDKALWYTAPLSRHTLSEQFKKRKRQTGLPWDAVLHSTRHTALTDFGAAGADAFTIQQIAGHHLFDHLAEIYSPSARDDSASSSATG